MENNNKLTALTTVLQALDGLDNEAKKSTLQAALTLLGISLDNVGINGNVQITESKHASHSNTGNRSVSFSENRNISPKEFLRDKSPQTDLERVGCLAYYLTHYRETPHFKNLELSTLNTEAAQPKFTNISSSADNALKAGLLVQATKGSKQISAMGESFVHALPDRELAKSIMANSRMRKRYKKNVSKKTNLNNNQL